MHRPDSIVFFLYLLIGPLPWLGLFAGYLLSASRMNRLRRVVPLPDQVPSVTVLIPAKDEGRDIIRCVQSVLAQDYTHFDILAIDDRSTDETGAILDQLAAASTRLQAMHIPIGGLPAGWLGKCHALATAAAIVQSDWLLFVDSDVQLQPDALSVALSNAIERKYDAVSILTRLECHTFWEKLVLPLAAATWATMFAVSATNNDNRKSNAAANGQFFLIRRTAYEAAGGHAAVRDQITEDVELMSRLKANDNRVRLLFGDHLASTRMHATLHQMIHGWGRIYSGTSRRRMSKIIMAIVLLPLIGISVYPALLLSVDHPIWLIAAMIHFTAMTGYLALIYRKAGQAKRLGDPLPPIVRLSADSPGLRPENVPHRPRLLARYPLRPVAAAQFDRGCETSKRNDTATAFERARRMT